MSGKTALLFALLVVLLVSSSASPAKADGGTGALAHKGAEPTGRMRAATRERRRAHLTEDEREMMTKQIVQALSGTCSRSELLRQIHHSFLHKPVLMVEKNLAELVSQKREKWTFMGHSFKTEP